MITADPVLNELSISPIAVNTQVARERISGLLEVLVPAPENGLGRSLRVAENFYTVELAEGYSIYDWLDDSSVPREQRVFFLELAAKTPFLANAPEASIDKAASTEVLFEQVESLAFRAAYILDVPLVSFRHSRWDQPQFTATLPQCFIIHRTNGLQTLAAWATDGVLASFPTLTFGERLEMAKHPVSWWSTPCCSRVPC